MQHRGLIGGSTFCGEAKPVSEGLLAVLPGIVIMFSNLYNELVGHARSTVLMRRRLPE